MARITTASTLTSRILGSQVTTSTSSTDTTPTLTPNSDEYPPLMTLFTPDPSCLSFYLNSCVGNTCFATAFPDAACYDTVGGVAVRNSLSCYPRTSLYTYSPGYFCPVGMTTVDSVSVANGAWCCMSGLTWTSGVCVKDTYRATLLSTNFKRCMDEGKITVDGALLLTATPILLTGQKLSMTAPSNSANFSSITSLTSLIPTSDSPSEAAKIGAILGGIFGIVSLLLLAAVCLRGHRKPKVAGKFQSEQAVNVEPDEYMVKPELEGSRAYVYTVKPELDASAIRAELGGDTIEPYGDGIYILKPELAGSAGTKGNRGVYVKKKPELEAISRPCDSPPVR